jgi:hypothetical protein
MLKLKLVVLGDPLAKKRHRHFARIVKGKIFQGTYSEQKGGGVGLYRPDHPPAAQGSSAHKRGDLLPSVFRASEAQVALWHGAEFGEIKTVRAKIPG